MAAIFKKIMNIKTQISKIFIFAICYLIFTIPVYASVDIGDQFGFGRNFGNSLGDIASKLVRPIFSIATFIVTWYFLWGAWDWLISEGDKQKVADARNKITQAIVGFLILILSFFLLQFVLHKLFDVNLGIIGI